MPRQSLLDYFQPDSRSQNETAVAWRHGYRTIRWSYGDLIRAARQFTRELEARGIAKGDRVLLWGENSGEWVAAFLGCMFRGAIAVPMDAIAEKSFAQRVVGRSGARLAVIDRGLPDSIAPLTLHFDHLDEAATSTPANPAKFSAVAATREDPVEIVFTSGTTAEPRGVVLTHGNILANIEPIEREFAHYRRYERIFHPLRFLDLLPLSHVFGQLLGIFLAQIFGATSVFLDTLNPAEVVRSIRNERVSALITVPRLIESLRDHMERDLESDGRLEKFRRDFKASQGEHFLRRWWRFRAIRRQFGWKFWAIVSGGAALPEAAEQFWTRLGYAVIQGYGLTETTSLVSLNHPFRLGRGSIGKALPGLEIELAENGEILVRGENVAAGYWKNSVGDSGVAPTLDVDGWFHTGDLGERDAAGNLYFKGRLKNVIVTPEGLNVYPQDLEAELRKEPGVRDCVVLGVERDGNAEPCAVLLLRDSDGRAEDAAAAAVEHANERLAPFQQMRRCLVWPSKDFPRTPTQKPVLGAIRAAVEEKFGGGDRLAASRPRASRVGHAPGPLADLLARFSHGRVSAESAGAKLQLSSIERVELMSALEDRYQVDLSETDFTNADTVGAIERLVEQRSEPVATFHYPRWAQSWPIRIVRALVLNLLGRPTMLLLGWPRVSGGEHLRTTRGPVLVVANHVAFFDPAYVWEALPSPLRCKLAVAMDGELLESFRKPPPDTNFITALAHRAAYWLVISVYNVFPLPRRAGFRKSFAFAGDLIDRGWTVLIFPEGTRTQDGRMSPFRAGIGLLATELDVPVVPAYLGGVFELKQAGKHVARPGQITVSLGAPARFASDVPAEEIARDLERRVSSLAARPSAPAL
jgi:long-chain acyl-CoA synthetase